MSDLERNLDRQAFSCAVDCSVMAEANHRIANELAELASFIAYKTHELVEAAQPPTREDVRLLAGSIDAQVQAVSHLHRMLTHRGRRSVPLDLSIILEDIAAALAGSGRKRISIERDLSTTCRVDPDRVLTISQIVTEAITNAIKHAYPANRMGRVLVRSRAGAGGETIIEVIDDGVGLNWVGDQHPAGKFGFRLMRALSESLGAELSFEPRHPGLCLRLTLDGDWTGREMSAPPAPVLPEGPPS